MMKNASPVLVKAATPRAFSYVHHMIFPSRILSTRLLPADLNVAALTEPFDGAEDADGVRKADIVLRPAVEMLSTIGVLMAQKARMRAQERMIFEPHARAQAQASEVRGNRVFTAAGTSGETDLAGATASEAHEFVGHAANISV
jgi:hypothetical protein